MNSRPTSPPDPPSSTGTVLPRSGESRRTGAGATSRGGETPSRGGGERVRSGPERWLRALFRIPLFYKILLANTVALGLAAGGGTWLAFRLGASGAGIEPWILAAGAALGGVLLAAAVNAVVLRLALAPLAALERTAARFQAGASPEDALVDDQPLADRDLDRLIHVFNEMIGSMARYRTRLRELAVQALETTEVERRRVADLLQDDTAQRLASLLIRLRLARRSDDADERDRLLEELREEAADTLETVRRVARGLHPPELDEIGVDQAVRAFVRGVQESGGPEIELDLEPVEDCLTDEARLALYRIVQEAVTNVHSHARARRASVRIVREEERVVGEVTDDGIGFRADREDRRPDADDSLGLVGMRERALHAGGQLRIMSRPGAGTRIRVELPCLAASGSRDPG